MLIEVDCWIERSRLVQEASERSWRVHGILDICERNIHILPTPLPARNVLVFNR